MDKYKIAKIYKLFNTINGDFYIGSTVNKYLCNRLSMHKYESTRANSKLYTAMKELGKENFKIELLETIECNCKRELTNREQYYIDTLLPTYNMNKTIPVDKEQYNKQYYTSIKNLAQRFCVIHNLF